MYWLTKVQFVLAVGKTTILDENMDIMKLLALVVQILGWGLGVAGVIGVVWAGILYLTARDNEGQVAKAKMRLVEIAIGLVVWALMFAVLNWLIPNFSEVQSSLE